MNGNKDILVVDFDDFAEDNNALDYLYMLKAKLPNFKATLFVPPMRCSRAFLSEVAKIEWLQMAIHGWEHTPQECNTWSEQTARFNLTTAMDWGVFVKGFKGPHWSASVGTYKACKDLDFWVADNADRRSSGIEMPTDQKIYITNMGYICPNVDTLGYERIHGHISWVPGLDNDITLLYHHILERGQGAEFMFIDEVIKKYYK